MQWPCSAFHMLWKWLPLSGIVPVFKHLHANPSYRVSGRVGTYQLNERNQENYKFLWKDFFAS